MEFHPVQPWICYADTSDRVRVWDWTTQQVRNVPGLQMHAYLVLSVEQLAGHCSLIGMFTFEF